MESEAELKTPCLPSKRTGLWFQFMNRLFAGIATLVLSLVAASAQNQPEVSLELIIGQTQFLPSEKLPVTVRITNQSGRTLKLGQDNDWLSFGIEETKGAVVVRRQDPQVDGEFELETTARASFTMDLAPHFDLSRPGSFKITAQMRLKELNLIVDSAPIAFDVIPGSIVWSQTFGIPPKANELNSPVDRRTYIIQQANYLREVRLYLRVTDASKGNTYAVVPIGNVVSFSKPSPMIDREARIHILHQYGMRVYAYHLFSPDGELLERRTYEIGETRPTLRVNESGNVIVVGGVRRFDKSDRAPASATNAQPSASTTPLPKP